MKREILPDNSGRRSGVDRRAFSYAMHIPERRFGEDRRNDFDRRPVVSVKQVDEVIKTLTG